MCSQKWRNRFLEWAASPYKLQMQSLSQISIIMITRNGKSSWFLKRTNRVEGWLLRLHGCVALNLLKGWCHSLSIVCLVNSKRFEEGVKAWESAQCRGKKNNQKTPTKILNHNKYQLWFHKKQRSILLSVKSNFPHPKSLFYYYHSLAHTTS